MKVPFGIHSVTAQMILSFIGVVILTAVAVGVPALWLLREQLQYQAWSQVDQGQRAANSLYAAKQSEVESLAILTAQRPTLGDLLIHGQPADMEDYLVALEKSLDIDIVSICDFDQSTLYNTQPALAVDPCKSWNLDGYQILPSDPVPQIWLSARYPIALNESNISDVIVGKVLDDRFVLQLRDQTGLENSIKVGNQFVATSFSGGTEQISLVNYADVSAILQEEQMRSTFEINSFPYYSTRFKLNDGEIWAEVALRVSPILATQQRLVLILIFSILFVTAYVFGTQMAIWSTLIMSLLFGIINPWGGFIPQIWISQVIGWFYIVVAGAIMGRTGKNGQRLQPRRWELAITGAFVTFIFEQVTNVGYSVTFGVPFVIAVTAAVPFTILHIISNTIIFSQVVPMLDSALTQQLKGLIWNAETEQDSKRETNLKYYGETVN